MNDDKECVWMMLLHHLLCECLTDFDQNFIFANLNL